MSKFGHLMVINKIINKLFNIFCLLKWRIYGLNTNYHNLVLGKSLDISNPQKLNLNHNVKLYKNTTIYINQKGSVTIGANSHIAPYAYILVADNNLTIGEKVAIGPFCSIFCHSNHYTNLTDFTASYIDQDIIIGNNVFIGAQCVILPGTIIEDNVVIGANSVVKGLVKANTLYAGNPLKIIKNL